MRIFAQSRTHFFLYSELFFFGTEETCWKNEVARSAMVPACSLDLGSQESVPFFLSFLSLFFLSICIHTFVYTGITELFDSIGDGVWSTLFGFCLVSSASIALRRKNVAYLLYLVGFKTRKKVNVILHFHPFCLQKSNEPSKCNITCLRVALKNSRWWGGNWHIFRFCCFLKNYIFYPLF